VAETELPNEDNLVVAFLVIWLLVDSAHIASLGVDVEYRRQGIARRLLCHALLECVQKGAREATLEVRVGNRAALALYEQLGFRTSGRRQKFYSDNGEDALIMTLDKLDGLSSSLTLGT
jgi:ribosomal-protein-alanine N-acetyltransferase